LHNNVGSFDTTRDLKQRGICVRVGMEATGYSRWLERLLAELGFEVWMGDPAEIKAKRIKKQKTERNDARLLRGMMLENSFPQVWIPSPENRDLWQLLLETQLLSSVNDFRYRLLEEKDGVELLPGLSYLVCQKRFRVHPQKL